MTDDLDPPIRIEFSSRQGLQQVALSAPEALQRSSQALQDAMGIVRQMAERVRLTVLSMPTRPSEIEVAFGIKFDAEAGAIVAKAGVEASINVIFRWDRQDRPGGSPPADPGQQAIPAGLPTP